MIILHNDYSENYFVLEQVSLHQVLTTLMTRNFQVILLKLHRLEYFWEQPFKKDHPVF